MEKDFLTIQDASVLLGKSVQTVRRLIKKGELKAQKIKTPQGFHYVIQRDSLGIKVLSSSPIQNEKTELKKADEKVLTNQNSIPTSQSGIEVQKKAVSKTVDKKASFDEKIPAKLPELLKPIKKNAIIKMNETKDESRNEIKNGTEAEKENENENEIARKAQMENGNSVQIKYVGRIEKIIEKTMECEKCDKREEQLKEVLKRQHVEKMGLIRVLEKLQNDLDFERRRPRSLLGYLMDWLLK